MKRASAYLCVLFLTGVSLSLSAVQSRQPGTIEGIVTVVGSNETVSGATVQLGMVLGVDFKVVSSTRTDSSGRFTVSGPPDNYMLWVAQDGFLRPFQRSGLLHLKLEAGQHIRDAHVTMLRSGAVSGRVLDEKGAPRAANVEIVSFVYRNGSRAVRPFRGGKSNDRGEFELDFIYPGTYLLRASAVENDSGLTTIYYPGVTSPDTATFFTIGQGDRIAGLNLQLPRHDVYRVRFKVSTVVPLPATAKTQFSMRPVGRQYQVDSILTQFESAPDGSFISSPLTPGEYVINISSMAPFASTTKWPYPTGSVSVVLKDKDVDLGTIPLTIGQDVPGRMTFKDIPEPSNGTPVGVRPFPPIDFGGLAVPPPATVAKDGTFKIDHYPEYRISRVGVTNLPKDAYVESIRFAGRDVLTQGLQLTGDASTLEVVVTGPGATISGTVRNARNQPFAQIHVVLVPPENRRGPAVEFQARMSDGEGRFSFANVPSGQYTVLALEDEVYWDGDQYYQMPEFLREYERLGTKVNATRGSKHSIEVRSVLIATRQAK